jgi:phosphoribosyl-ATP pyrophosphohydrolase/phosphoribosyl-AMP cyclohydrolase
MLGYMNAEALRLTLVSGLVHFFSRSRQRIWMKGESSGNTLALRTIRADCDQDSLLVQVMPKGSVCHTGQETCWGAASAGTLQRLELRLLARIADADPEKSYTARLVAGGLPRIAQKVGEEGVECALAAVVGTPQALAGEAADLLYHLTLLLQQRGLSLQEVWDVLEERALKPG